MCVFSLFLTSICDQVTTVTPITGLTKWEGGGLITEKKEPKVVPFRSLDDCCVNPGGLGDGLVSSCRQHSALCTVGHNDCDVECSTFGFHIQRTK